ncbi:hypothetical protein SAMN06272722_11182 [Paenibacillus sp. RU5A]|nr:hypothetical protein SAMN06272722_11182 [Paenibacillus sp. RU5A]SOC74741.1 hypothetical protein SAMN05880581_11182 [Paenibacillus sp. RU26A]SOC76870.1 hypothetical protein SAMN05880586_11182 [Paenibacillus sp. RU5M]
MVRSKSELVIATKLYNQKIDYQYERELEGIDVLGNRSRILRPDFSIETVAGDLLIWEHLGMMNRESYRKGWEWKKAWYEHNGYTLGNNLFITMDDEKGELDANEVERIVTVVKERMNEF